MDALIAACAVLKNASLATDNISEFEYFVAHGLQLCESTKFAFALGILVSACKQFAHGLKAVQNLGLLRVRKHSFKWIALT